MFNTNLNLNYEGKYTKDQDWPAQHKIWKGKDVSRIIKMSNYNYTKVILNVKFAGEAKAFKEWKLKANSISRKKKFSMFFFKSFSPLHIEEEIEKDDKKMYIYNRNNDTWDRLVLSLISTPFNHVQKCEGGARITWATLLENNDVLAEKQKSLVEVIEEWNNYKLKSIKMDQRN